jgi:hypothetical protein
MSGSLKSCTVNHPPAAACPPWPYGTTEDRQAAHVVVVDGARVVGPDLARYMLISAAVVTLAQVIKL